MKAETSAVVTVLQCVQTLNHYVVRLKQRREVDGPRRVKHLEISFPVSIPQIDTLRQEYQDSQRRRLGPAWTEDRRPHTFCSRSQEKETTLSFPSYSCTERPQGGQKGSDAKSTYP